MHWLTEPGVKPGQRNAGIERARVTIEAFEQYEDRWDLLHDSTTDSPVLLPSDYRSYAKEDRVGLPPDHPWVFGLPDW